MRLDRHLYGGTVLASCERYTSLSGSDSRAPLPFGAGTQFRSPCRHQRAREKPQMQEPQYAVFEPGNVFSWFRGIAWTHQ